jgi:hypothetical protein
MLRDVLVVSAITVFLAARGALESNKVGVEESRIRSTIKNPISIRNLRGIDEESVPYTGR